MTKLTNGLLANLNTFLTMSNFSYCQCFNAARVCNSMCRCVMCSNTDSNESGRSEAVKIILDRNPAAFDSKFLSVSNFPT